MSYLKIHDDIKFAINLDLISLAEIPQLPQSTFYHIRASDLSHIILPEHVGLEPSAILLGKRAAAFVSKKANQIIRCYKAVIRVLTIKKPLSSMIKLAARTTKNSKFLIVRTIRRVSEFIPLKKVCKIFGITYSQFYSWLKQIYSFCPLSPINTCPSKHPNQLTPDEIEKMKAILLNPLYKGWSVFAIAMKSFRDNLLIACVSTWYKYIKLLGLKWSIPPSRRKNHDNGIRADCPNDIIHMDVTEIVNNDFSKSYITTAIDNYSRFVLAYAVTTAKSAKTCVEVLERALFTMNQLSVIPSHFQIKLITDGGSENKGPVFDSFTSREEIKHLIAQDHIRFSNSMVEASHKGLKYYGLYVVPSPNHEFTVKRVDAYFKSYNYERPHSGINGLIPIEAYVGITAPSDRWRLKKVEEKQKRIAQNQNLSCFSCSYNSPEYSI